MSGAESDLERGVVNPIEIELSDENLHKDAHSSLDHTPHKVSVTACLPISAGSILRISNSI